VRFHYKKHLDPATGIPFPAKARVTPEQIAALEKRFPGGYFEPVVRNDVVYDGFGTYLQVVDGLGAAQGDALKGWRQKMDAKLGRAAAVAK
jgi:hypothetical protein